MNVGDKVEIKSATGFRGVSTDWKVAALAAWHIRELRRGLMARIETRVSVPCKVSNKGNLTDAIITLGDNGLQVTYPFTKPQEPTRATKKAPKASKPKRKRKG